MGQDDRPPERASSGLRKWRELSIQAHLRRPSGYSRRLAPATVCLAKTEASLISGPRDRPLLLWVMSRSRWTRPARRSISPRVQQFGRWKNGSLTMINLTVDWNRFSRWALSSSGLSDRSRTCRNRMDRISGRQDFGLATLGYRSPIAHPERHRLCDRQYADCAKKGTAVSCALRRQESKIFPAGRRLRRSPRSRRALRIAGNRPRPRRQLFQLPQSEPRR